MQLWQLSFVEHVPPLAVAPGIQTVVVVVVVLVLVVDWVVVGVLAFTTNIFAVVVVVDLDCVLARRVLAWVLRAAAAAAAAAAAVAAAPAPPANVLCREWGIVVPVKLQWPLLQTIF